MSGFPHTRSDEGYIMKPFLVLGDNVNIHHLSRTLGHAAGIRVDTYRDVSGDVCPSGYVCV